MSECCLVEWCVCLQDDTGYCSVHSLRVDLRPMPLAANEELIDGSFGPCEACEKRYFNRKESTWVTKSTGECAECRGSGECGDQCGHGHACSAECEECDGTGNCKVCGGTGYGGVRIRVTEAA